MGQRPRRSRRAFATYLGVRHAAAVSSGTAALHLICLVEGDAVLGPSLTFVATVNAIRSTGAPPRFADIAGPLEPWLSPRACRELVGPRTRAILHMPFGGHPG